MRSAPIITTSTSRIRAIRTGGAGPARGGIRSGKPGSGFTILEILVAMAILMIILTLLFVMLGHASGVLRQSTAQVEAFQSARLAFDLLTRNLSQATLNTHLEYAFDNGSNQPPTRYYRDSSLGFVVGQAGGQVTAPDGASAALPGSPHTGQAVFFEGPLNYVTNTAAYSGMESLLNACGYYVSFTTNQVLPPHVSAGSDAYRYRLIQMLAPSEANTVYKANIGNGWFAGASLQGAHATTVADNVIALIIRPQDPATNPADLSTNFAYDSRAGALAKPQPATANQLPPNLNVTMIVIDEASAKRFENGAQEPPVIATALNGKFQETGSYQTDLDQLKDALNAARIQYRVFESTVPLRESKWTK